MERYFAHLYVQFYLDLGSLEGVLRYRDRTRADRDTPIDDEFVTLLNNSMALNEAILKDYPFTAKMTALKWTTKNTHGDVRQRLQEMTRRLVDEMESHIYLTVEPKLVPYYDEPNLFGEGVFNKFPMSTFDIEEAGKCLALGRGTAAIFHLMRIMEVGLNSLADRLQLSRSSNRTWDAILSKCDAEAQKKFQDKTTEWRDNEEFYSGAAAMLRQVKNAWRNPTMHIDRKYTDEEARDIFTHVRGFMRHLRVCPINLFLPGR